MMFAWKRQLVAQAFGDLVASLTNHASQPGVFAVCGFSFSCQVKESDKEQLFVVESLCRLP